MPQGARPLRGELLSRAAALHTTAINEIVQGLGNRVDGTGQQMAPGARTHDTPKLPLRLINFLEIRIVADRLDALLQGTRALRVDLRSRSGVAGTFRTFSISGLFLQPFLAGRTVVNVVLKQH